MTFSESVSICFRKTFISKERASRSEFWWFYLFTILSVVALTVLNALFGSMLNPVISQLSYGFAILATSFPLWSASVRRLHDTNRTGWWLLLSLIPLGGIVLLVLLAMPTKNEGNRYGSEPLS